MGSTITLKTLATELGVSTTTVSNAYSKPDRLSADLRERIFEKAEELGYCGPSAAGRALRSGKADVCGFLFGGELSRAFSDPYSVIFLSGLSESVEQSGASVLLVRALPDNQENQLLDRAAIDALVVASPISEHPDLERVGRRGIRLVSTQQSEDGDWVAINDIKAGRSVGKHLARLGHRNVVVVVAEGSDSEFGADELPLDDILDGTRPVCAYELARIKGLREKLPDVSFRVVSAGYNTRESGRAAAAHSLDDQNRPTAIVALSDVLALGVWDAVTERGLKPGRDVSITGFDDIPDAAFLGITTVHQPIAEKGRLAGRLAMDPDYPTRQILLPTELVVRASTGPAPKN